MKEKMVVWYVEGNRAQHVRHPCVVQQGMVEKWLDQVETAMLESLKVITMKSLKNYGETHRKKWVLEWPGQIILCVSQKYWTSEVEEALADNKLAVSTYHQTYLLFFQIYKLSTIILL